jgi:hypothetical protein
MNNITSARPRLTCRVVRYRRALFDNTGSAHLSACADCQAFFRATDEQDLALHHAALAMRRAEPEPSPEWERTVLRAVREASAKAAPARARSRTPVWAMGAVAAAAITAVFYLQRPGTPDSVTTNPEDALAVVDAVENLSVKLTGTVIPATGAMVADNPLQRELGSVYSDARSALDFLALNFLPTASRPTAPKSPYPI